MAALGRSLRALRTLARREPLVELEGHSKVAVSRWRIE
jgi:hypothetical protein